ncbi:MAG: hypothetical protein WCS16_04060 [Desulfuromonas sp.]
MFVAPRQCLLISTVLVLTFGATKDKGDEDKGDEDKGDEDKGDEDKGDVLA